MGRLHGAGLVAGALVLSGGSLAAFAPAAGAAGTLFQPYQTYHPGSSPANVAIGDVTGDGRPDVLLTTDYDFNPALDFSLWVYPQQTDGTLGTPTQLQTHGTYGSDMAVAVADLDQDGDLDAAVTTDAGVEIFNQGDSGLSYSWTVPIEEGRDLELVDVSGDDLADLVVNGQYGIEVWWQIAGDFMRSPVGSKLTSTFHTEVEVADVTGDGLADVVSSKGSTIDVHAQRPDHSFATPVSYGSGGVTGWETVNGLAVGDTDGDGLADVHASGGGNSPNAWVVTRVQQQDGTLGNPHLRKSYDIPESIEVADVTGDGRDDLVVLHGGWNRMGVYDMTPGTMEAESLYAIPYASHYDAKALAIGDVSGDGRADVAIADYNNGLVLLHGAAPTDDIAAPDTAITSGPSGTHRSRTASFSFTATEPSTFTCSLDGSVWQACTSPMTYEGLSQGTHTFQVRATDAAGNADTSSAQRTFTVDGPDTTITSGPSGTVRSTSVSFGFSASPAASSYECSMDGAGWTACTSPTTYTGLATGQTHTFRVRGVSADGLVDSSPAGRSFTLEAQADLALTLNGAPQPVKRRDTLTYTAVVTNLGGDAAEKVALAQTLPDGVTFLSVSAEPDWLSTSPVTCSAGGSPTTVRCDLAAIPAGTAWTMTVRARVEVSKGSLSSSAVVAASTWDPNRDNDAASLSVKVTNGK